MRVFLLLTSIWSCFFISPAMAQDEQVRLKILSISNFAVKIHIAIYERDHSNTNARMTFHMDVIPDGKDSMIVLLPSRPAGDFGIAISQDIISRQANNIFNPAPVIYARDLPRKISIDQFERCHITLRPTASFFDVALAN